MQYINKTVSFYVFLQKIGLDIIKFQFLEK